MLTELNGQSKVILNAETEVKIALNRETTPITKGPVNSITKTNIIKKTHPKGITNQEGSWY